MNYEERILEHLSQAGKKPRTCRGLAKRFEVGAEDYALFKSVVRRLIKEGKIAQSKDRTLRMSERDHNVVGTFRRSARGFGFVRPKAAAAGRGDEIYIPPEAGLDASTGDEVAVRITKRPHTPGFKLEGRVVRVLARASGLFVGTYEEAAGAGYVKVDGTAFRHPIFVGDPGAKGARPGDKVAFEMARYPSPGFEGEGVITEILGPRGQPGVDTLGIIRAYDIPDVFDDDVLHEARELARTFDPDRVEGRRDLRETLTVTIDPENARDFDDAISLSRDSKGYWSLGVHIADVSYFVKPGSALDRAARKRGTSVYLPDRVIPMLPEVLSNSLASLQQGHTRLTMSVFMEFDADGNRTHYEFARSAIAVARRFTYEQAYEVMKQPAAGDDPLPKELRSMLGEMLELAMILRRRRKERGALELDMPEVEVELGELGQVVGAHLAVNDESHQVIEEFMLAANEAVSEDLSRKGVGFLRRGHPEPEPRKLRQFAEFVASLGYQLENPQSRFELQRVLEESARSPERHAVHYGLLRSLKQATYTPEDQGHYALAKSDYCHFTSPIRRYPDLQVHRQLGAVLSGKTPTSDPEELASLAEHCTRTERRAEAAERELIKIKLLTHLATEIGNRFKAVIIGVEDFGFFAQLAELPIDGLIHVTSLADDYYYLESETHTLIGRRAGRQFRLGDSIDVTIGRVDVDRRELDLIPADESASRAVPSERVPVGRGRRLAGPAPGARRAKGDTRKRPANRTSKKKKRKR